MLFVKTLGLHNILLQLVDQRITTADKYSGILESPTTNGQDITITYNLVQYGDGVPTKKMKPHLNLANSDKIVAPYGKKTSDGDPFSTKNFTDGIFVPAETYATYGAQR